MEIQTKNFLSIEQIKDQYLGIDTKRNAGKTSQSFKDILEKASEQNLKPVKFSKHAANRLNDRNISLSNEQLQRLNEATVKAQAKGINESLVLMDSMAFIVSIPNNTVVTAMDQNLADERIFTNIDGAVIA